MKLSPLQIARYQYQPKLPGMLRNGIAEISATSGGPTQSVADQEKIAALFPNTYGKNEIIFEKGVNTSEARKLTVGVILSGGQAPGGHNVISGLYDSLKAINPENVLIGFKGGPSGLLDNDFVVFDDEYINAYRNTGGFDIIGSGRTKLETQEQFAVVVENCKTHGVNALVIIGGDDSNTNAAVLAEYCAAHNTGIQVIGCPKTIDGDLKNEDIECSFGFDTAAKTYSEIIGNIERDANSAKKYWHFVKVMGRSASHVALECALQTRPNICLVGEEVAAKKRPGFLMDFLKARSLSFKATRAQYPNYLKPWTKEADLQLQDLMKSGLSLKKVAERMGRNPGAIEARLAKLEELEE